MSAMPMLYNTLPVRIYTKILQEVDSQTRRDPQYCWSMQVGLLLT